MKEGQHIGLSAFVKDLSVVSETTPQDLNKVATQKVVFPAHAEDGEVEAKNLQYRSEEDPDFYIRLSADFAIPQDELEPIVQEALGRGKSLKLPKGQYETRLKQWWTPQDFSVETGLPSFLHSKTSITSHATTIRPEQVRLLGANQRIHRAKVDLERNILTVEAEGEYKRHLRNISDALDPQLVTIRLSKEDAEKVIQLNEHTALGRLFAGQIRKKLEPQSRALVQISVGAGISFDTQDVIEVTVVKGQLQYLEEQLHKDLFRPAENQETQVVRLMKVYSLAAIVKNRRYADMKKAVGMLEGIAFSSYGNYAITEAQAKVLLDKELQVVQDFYSDDIRAIFALGGNMHIFRGNLVKRLARELLGSEVVEPMEELKVDEYVAFLASQGYMPGQFMVGHLSLPSYSVSERHLLEFYKQVYERDPKKAAALYRMGYMNTHPLLTIDSDERQDGSKIKCLEIASKAKIYSFEITQNMGSSGNNDFSFGRITPRSDNAHFWSRTNLHGSVLLPLQEWACDKVGITFTK